MLAITAALNGWIRNEFRDLSFVRQTAEPCIHLCDVNADGYFERLN